MEACENDYIEVVKLLVEKYDANINHQDQVIQSAYCLKSPYNLFCLNIYSQDGYTPSYMAVKENNQDIILYLKSLGALKAKVCRSYYDVD